MRRTLLAGGRPATAAQLARYAGISESYLHKILAALVRAEIVESSRGHGGGYVLADPSGGQSLLTIAQALGLKLDAAPAPGLYHHSDLATSCFIDRALDDSLDHARRALRKHTIASLSLSLRDPRLGGRPDIVEAFTRRFDRL
ncbi:Rrf2 family transcriptional regulator [Dermacoccus nishinomiyaensis]|uniref:Rrf2 family transcriptional regulator n=1 Tax=Dermacoccus nishinomiyaensis TaxID=1274 RepID=UPI0013F449DD|nr:Rrf2 family transcriptional regulator [Dermacoccus nishinomiyaensis]